MNAVYSSVKYTRDRYQSQCEIKDFLWLSDVVGEEFGVTWPHQWSKTILNWCTLYAIKWRNIKRTHRVIHFIDLIYWQIATANVNWLLARRASHCTRYLNIFDNISFSFPYFRYWTWEKKIKMSGRDKSYPVSAGSGAMGRLMSKIKRTVSESVSKFLRWGPAL